MAVPSSGEISLLKIQREIFDSNYAGSNSHTDVILADLSTGQDEDINTDGWLATTNTSSPAQTGANIASQPHSMSEFYGYDHDHLAQVILHSTTFQPQMREWIVPYQPVRQGSGFTTSNNLSNNAPNNMGSVTSAGTFTVGGLTGVNLSAMYNYDSNKSSDANNGEKIILQFHSTGTTNFADSGWTTCKIYNGSSNSGTLVVTLTRSSATSFSSTITSVASGTRALYTFNGTRAFSNHFGTDGTASNNDQHFLEIIE